MDIDSIIDQYYERIYKLCLFYLNNKEEAEEILQEIFIKIMGKRHTFKGNSAVYTWIYRIAVNTLLNYLNRKKFLEFISFDLVKNDEGTPDFQGSGSSHGDPAVLYEKEEIRQWQLEQLEYCILKLSRREKTAFYFFHYDRLKHKEIAEIMNTSIPAVESLLHKAMKKIKTCAANFE